LAFIEKAGLMLLNTGFMRGDNPQTHPENSRRNYISRHKLDGRAELRGIAKIKSFKKNIVIITTTRKKSGHNLIDKLKVLSVKILHSR